MKYLLGLLVVVLALTLSVGPAQAQMTYGGTHPCQYRLPGGMLATSMSMGFTGVGITFTMYHVCMVTGPAATGNGAMCVVSNISPAMSPGPYGSFCNTMTITAGGLSGTMPMTSMCAGLLAQAPYGPGAHMCSFTCAGCPGNQTTGTSYVIDNSGGLPVELMDFAVAVSSSGEE